MPNALTNGNITADETNNTFSAADTETNSELFCSDILEVKNLAEPAPPYSGVYYESDGDIISSASIMECKSVPESYKMYVMSGGVAIKTSINNGGCMLVSAGGSANSTYVDSAGVMQIFSGGSATGTTIYSGGGLWVSSGGVANDNTLSSGAVLVLYSDAAANSTTVNPGGTAYVIGASAYNIIENGGCVSIQLNASFTFAPNVFSGTTVSNSVFSGNSASSQGGAILNGLSATVGNSTFTGNTAKNGGAIATLGNLYVSGSVFSANTAPQDEIGFIDEISFFESYPALWSAESSTLLDTMDDSTGLSVSAKLA